MSCKLDCDLHFFWARLLFGTWLVPFPSYSFPRIHQTGGKPSQSTAREFFSQLNKESVRSVLKRSFDNDLQLTTTSQVKSLYDKYEVDMEMWDYRIEPYLSYAGLHNIMAVEESVSFIPFLFS